MEAGDVILLIQGGHGFEVLEDLEMFEMKEEWYTREIGKNRFLSGQAARAQSQLSYVIRLMFDNDFHELVLKEDWSNET